MQAHEIRPTQPRQGRKRVGRGTGSGHGTYSGRGVKGQKARTGGRIRPGFEGGQLPLIKGLPQLRGFKNMFRTEYEIVNLEQLETLSKSIKHVTPEMMKSHGLIHHENRLVKVLGEGELSRPLHVAAHKFSQSARAKIEAAGGQVEER